MVKASFTPAAQPKLPENKKVPEEINGIYERDRYFRVSIRGSKGDEYTIFVVRDLFLCSCESGKHRDKDCKHITLLRNYLEA